MPDVWETRTGLNPLRDDASSDSDGDGIPNYDEYRTKTSAANADSNGDGISDGNTDSDVDGVRNAVEVAARLEALDARLRTATA